MDQNDARAQPPAGGLAQQYLTHIHNGHRRTAIVDYARHTRGRTRQTISPPPPNGPRAPRNCSPPPPHWTAFQESVSCRPVAKPPPPAWRPARSGLWPIGTEETA